MDPKGILKAKSRLRVAEKAARELNDCKSHDDFTDTWYSFLTASKNIYTVLEQAAKVTPQSRQWFGSKSKERRADELLQYLYEARNDDEHGLEPISRHEPGYLSIGVAKAGFSTSMRIDTSDPRGSINVESLDGKPILIQHKPSSFTLIEVQSRGRTVPVPTKHKGQLLEDLSPVAVANLGLAHLSELVAGAEKLTIQDTR